MKNLDQHSDSITDLRNEFEEIWEKHQKLKELKFDGDDIELGLKKLAERVASLAKNTNKKKKFNRLAALFYEINDILWYDYSSDVPIFPYFQSS